MARILEALDGLDLCDEVVVIFTSDNGLMVGEHGFVGKTLMHEESIRGSRPGSVRATQRTWHGRNATDSAG